MRSTSLPAEGDPFPTDAGRRYEAGTLQSGQFPLNGSTAPIHPPDDLIGIETTIRIAVQQAKHTPPNATEQGIRQPNGLSIHFTPGDANSQYGYGDTL